jgi:hypothetical protein
MSSSHDLFLDFRSILRIAHPDAVLIGATLVKDNKRYGS